jgi:hypothetical protein
VRSMLVRGGVWSIQNLNCGRRARPEATTL